MLGTGHAGHRGSGEAAHLQAGQAKQAQTGKAEVMALLGCNGFRCMAVSRGNSWRILTSGRQSEGGGLHLWGGRLTRSPRTAQAGPCRVARVAAAGQAEELACRRKSDATPLYS